MLNPLKGFTAYVCTKDTDEVYAAHPMKIVADVRSHFRISEEKAIQMIKDATIDTPIDMGNCEVWSEL